MGTRTPLPQTDNLIEDTFDDFGFTAVDEAELEAVQKATQESTAVVVATEEKLQRLYSAILPLLKNLKANPDKDYIYWPNRIEKVEAFEKHIKRIVDE